MAQGRQAESRIEGMQRAEELSTHDNTSCPYAPKPGTPRLVWSGMEERKMVEPAPAQVVEVVTPGLADKQAELALEVMREGITAYTKPGEPPSPNFFGPSPPAYQRRAPGTSCGTV